MDYEQGWVPASYLEKADGGEEPEGKRAKPGQGRVKIDGHTHIQIDSLVFVFL